MRDLSQSARLDEFPAAAPAGGIHTLRRMPQRDRPRTAGRRSADAVRQPQHVRSALSELHHLPRPHSRVECRPVLFEVSAAMRTLPILCAVSLLAIGAAAQPVAAPTPEPVGKPRGNNTGDYNIVDSMETGYRFLTLGGSLDQYRSMVNYGNGVRLLSSYFTMNSRDGHGHYFDEIVLTTQGL